MVGKLCIVTVLSATTLLAGIHYGGAQATAGPQGAAPMPTTREQAVTFPSRGGLRLAGTLTWPALPGAALPGAARVPGLVLIAGSGPTDRDGNQAELHTDLLKQIATRLAQAGIAALRYDKRGIGGSKKDVKPEEWSDFAAWEGFVGDAADALAFLQQQPGIDASRTGMLGHSEGGLLALQAARDIAVTHAAGGPQPPAVLVLASTPGRRLDMVVHDQLVNLLRRQGATAEQTKYFLDKNDSIVETIRQTGVVPADVPPGLAALYPAYLGKFYHSAIAVDPPQLASRFPGPVLVLQGEKDVQVRADADATALDAGLKARPHEDHQLIVIPGVSHNFKPVKDVTDPGFEGPVAAPALNKLAGWLKVKLVATAPAKQ